MGLVPPQPETIAAVPTTAANMAAACLIPAVFLLFLTIVLIVCTFPIDNPFACSVTQAIFSASSLHREQNLLILLREQCVFVDRPVRDRPHQRQETVSVNIVRQV